MTPTMGRRPKTGDAPLMVQFRNGWIGGPYTAAQLVWKDRDYEWDVTAVERIKGGTNGK